MPRTRRELLAVTASCITLAGCSGSGDSTDTPADGSGDGDGGDGSGSGTPTDSGGTGTDAATPTTTADTDGGSGSATVAVRSHPDLGEVLVDGEGRTLYMFDSDERGDGASTCTGGCVENWPPLTVRGDPVAGEDVEAELTTFERRDGSTQVAASGWPLYYFAADEGPGDVAGQGVGDVWWVLGPDGTPVRTSTPTDTETTADTATPSPTDPGTPTSGETPTDGETTSEPAQTVEVAPGGELVFDPASFEVSVGDTVRWVWRASGHNVRADETPAGSDWRGTPGDDLFDEGYEYTHTFETAGEYAYYCVPHRGLGMDGSFTVTE